MYMYHTHYNKNKIYFDPLPPLSLPLQGSPFRAGVLFQSMVGDGVHYSVRSYAAMLAAYSQ